jgi:alpha-glucoside transport system permease protein
MSTGLARHFQRSWYAVGLSGALTILIGVEGTSSRSFVAVEHVAGQGAVPARRLNASRNINRANLIRPCWLHFTPPSSLALALSGHPIGSFIRSLYDRSGDQFVTGGYLHSLICMHGFRTAFMRQC